MVSGLAGEMKDEIQRVFLLQQANKIKVGQSLPGERINKLKKILNYIYNHMDEIQDAVYRDFKKPAEEVLITEIYPVTSEIKHIIKHLKRWMKPVPAKPGLSFIGAKCRVRYEARGVSLIISPWNFPFQLALGPIVSAVAAGNCIVLKPSEFTPHTDEVLKKLVEELFNENEAAVFNGDYQVSQALLELPFDNIFFTGSPAVGRMVMEQAAKHLTPVTLELGGKSPVIIDNSADLRQAASRIMWGKCVNGGQVCVAPDYVLIPEGRAEEFVKLAVEYVEKYYGCGDDICGSPDFCRIINKKNFSRIKGLVEDARAMGAKVELGGVFKEDDNFISPTVLTKVPKDSAIMQEEIFGPVLPVITYRDINEAVSLINSKPRPLALYVFSRDKRGSDFILNNIISGDAVINDVVLHFANSNLPFGGINNSGLGKSHGFYGFKAFSHERAVMSQPRLTAMQMMYPPFNDRIRKLAKLIIKWM